MKIRKISKTLLLKTTSFQVKVLQKKFTLPLHADFSKIVLEYSNEVHLLRYLTPLFVCMQWRNFGISVDGQV
jgi:hypothetical protein